MIFSEYLKNINSFIHEPTQQEWYGRLKSGVAEGVGAFEDIAELKKQLILAEFEKRVRTEELKAWYGSSDENILFQGTSISSLTIPGSSCKSERMQPNP